MSSTWGRLVLAALAVALATGAWLLLGGGGDAGRGGGEGVRPTARSAPPVSQPQTRGAALAPSAPEAGPGAATRTVPGRPDSLAAGQREQATEGSRVLQGRVVVPPGAPAEPELAVVARARAGRERIEARARVDGSGRFQLELPRGARRVRFELEARYLHLDGSEPVDLEDLPEEVVLEPRLGGCLLVRLVVPSGGDPAELEGARVQLYGDGQASRRAEADGTGTARFDGVPAALNLHVHAEPEGFVMVDSGTTLVSVPAGGERELDLRIERDVRLQGIVRGEDGQPLAGASLSTRVSAPHHAWRMDAGSTDADGSFDLRGVRAGRIALIAAGAGHLEGTLELGELAAGEVRADLEIVLRRGASVSGRVTWPDGVGAEDVWVVAESPDEESAQPHRARSDAEGRFELGGLREGPYALSVSARPRREVLARLTAAGAVEAKGGARPQLLARVEGISPGTVGLELALAAAAPIRGRVVDEAGRPFERARVLVIAQGSPDAYGQPVWRKVQEPEGTFELPGFGPGTYLLSASGGAGPGEAVRVVVPQLGAGAVLVAPRGGDVEGRVVSGDAPVARALVRLKRDGSPPRGGGHARHFQEDFDRSLPTQADGVFRFESVAPGLYHLSAEIAGQGASERVPVTLAAGERRAGLVLELASPGWIEGRLAADLSPVQGRRIQIHERDRGFWKLVRTDSEGRFEIHGLAPGTYDVQVQEPNDDLDHYRTVSTTAEVTAGRGTRVLLTREARPVRVLGRVVRGERPVADLEVGAFSSTGRQVPSTRTDAAGRFELTLPKGGRTIFLLGDRFAAVHQERAVPQQAEAEVVLELPTGSLSGRLVTRAGAPAAYARVVLGGAERHGSVPKRYTRGDAQGFFTFEHVGPGRYALEGGGSGFARFQTAGDEPVDPDELYGHARSQPLELREGQSRTDLRLVLPAPASISGAVRSAGPLPERMWLLARPADEPAGGDAAASVVRDGRYRLRGLGPGAHVVTLATGGPQGNQSRTVTLAEGQDLILDFELE